MIIFNIRQKLFKQLSAKLAFIVVNFSKYSLIIMKKKKCIERKKKYIKKKKIKCIGLNSKIETS